MSTIFKERTITNKPIEEGDELYSLVITGTKAQELLANETFIATVNELTTQITDQILGSAINEHVMRQNLYMLFKALENLTRILKASASTKELVQNQLDAIDEEEDLTTDNNED